MPFSRRLVSPFIAHWKKLGVQQPRIPSDSLGKTAAMDPVRQRICDAVLYYKVHHFTKTGSGRT